VHNVAKIMSVRAHAGFLRDIAREHGVSENSWRNGGCSNC
jgi:hypothetical protein